MSIGDLAPNPVSPSDCALIVTIPVTRTAFEQDLLPHRDKDFAKSYSKQLPGLTTAALWTAYEPHAAFARHVMDAAKRQGVSVVENATLSDFLSALTIAKVTTLIGHWRSARFRPTDIVEEQQIATFLNRHQISEGTGNLTTRLNNHLDLRAHQEQQHASSRPLAALTAKHHAWYEARKYFEDALPGCFRGGPGVEFNEGFHGINHITERLSPKYAGTLDLTVCQSVLLGDAIKRQCPASLTLASAGLTSLGFRLALYLQTIEVIHAHAMAWPDAIMSIRKELIAQL